MKHLTSHISKYDLIDIHQSGFRQYHSCHTTLTNRVDKWLTNINENKFTGVLFIDFAKAFDVLDHDLLFRKLELYNFSKPLLSLLKSFLTNRMHAVSVNNTLSGFLKQNFGVPQGSVLGPLLFSLYINDLPLYIKSSCELFADDTTIYSCNSDLVQLSNSLQESVNKLIKWTEYNHMSLNESKTKYMLITTRQKRQNLTNNSHLIVIGDHKLEEVNQHKVLGLMIDNNLTWSPHITKVCRIVSQKVFQLSKIKNFLDIEARKHFYHAHIQSLFDYVSTIFDTCSANTIRPLRSIHRRAIKIVRLASSSLTPQDYIDLNILPLSLKLQLNKSVFMYKIMNGLAPPSLTSKFQVNSSRYSDNILIPKPRVDIFKTSLLYSGGTLWNSMPKFIKDSRSIDTFKLHYKSYLLKNVK